MTLTIPDIKKRAVSLSAAAILFVACASGAMADSQYVSEDQFYDKIDGVNVYISSDHYLYHFSGEIPGVTICGYEGKKTDLVFPEEINGRAVAAIDDGMLAGDSQITSVTFPASMISIGEGSFCGCDKLDSVTLTGSVNVLTDVFCDCPRLKEVVIPYGVSEINNSFRNCLALQSVKFSRSVTKLGDGSFNGCGSLEKIEWSTGLSYLGDVFDGSKMLTTIHIPKGVVTIDGAFDNCAFAEVLELPDSLLYINSGFNGCTALRSLKLPHGLIYLGNAFEGCTALRSVTVPNGAEMDGAFANCPDIVVTHKSDKPRYVWVTLIALVLLCGTGYAVYKGVNRMPKDADKDLSA